MLSYSMEKSHIKKSSKEHTCLRNKGHDWCIKFRIFVVKILTEMLPSKCKESPANIPIIAYTDNDLLHKNILNNHGSGTSPTSWFVNHQRNVSWRRVVTTFMDSLLRSIRRMFYKPGVNPIRLTRTLENGHFTYRVSPKKTLAVWLHVRWKRLY